MPQLIRQEVVVDGARAIVKEHRLAGPYGLREERTRWLTGPAAGTVTRRSVTGVPGRPGSFEVLVGTHAIPADHF